MKTRMFISAVLFSLISMGIIYGCKKKEDAASVTGADYAGSWTVSSNCGNYPMTISASGDNLTISNFHVDFAVSATVSGNSLTIPSQARTGASGNGPYTFAGTGTKNGNSLSITYTVKDGGATTNCSATATK